MYSGLGRQIGRSDADIHGAIVIAFQLGTQGSGLDIGFLGYDDEDGRLPGKFIESHTCTGGSHRLRGIPPADGQVVGLAVTGRGRKAHSL